MSISINFHKACAAVIFACAICVAAVGPAVLPPPPFPSSPSAVAGPGLVPPPPIPVPPPQLT